jgi:hypothetical protein
MMGQLRGLFRFQNPDSTKDLNDRFSGLVLRGVLDPGAAHPSGAGQVITPVVVRVPGMLAVDVLGFMAVGADGMVVVHDAPPYTRLGLTASITQYVVVRTVYQPAGAPDTVFEVLSTADWSALSSTEKAKRIILAKVTAGVSSVVSDSDVDLRENDIVDKFDRYFIRGVVQSNSMLPTDSPTAVKRVKTGDVYLVIDDRQFWRWSGTSWETVTDQYVNTDLQWHKGVNGPTVVLAGTVTATNGLVAVTSGSGTSFLTNLFIGDKVRFDSESSIYVVAGSITNTSFDLTTPYTGITGAGKIVTITHLNAEDGGTPIVSPPLGTRDAGHYPAHVAKSIQYAPPGGSFVTARNVQDALSEIDVEKVKKAGDTMSGQLTINRTGGVGLSVTTTTGGNAIEATSSGGDKGGVFVGGTGVAGGTGVHATGAASSGGVGGKGIEAFGGTGTTGGGTAIVATGSGTAVNDGGLGVQAFGGATSSASLGATGGYGAVATGGTNTGTGAGGVGVSGSGGFTTGGGIGGSGVFGLGGAPSSTGNGGTGVHGQGGSPAGSGVGGTGVFGGGGSGGDGGAGVWGEGFTGGPGGVFLGPGTTQSNQFWTASAWYGAGLYAQGGTSDGPGVYAKGSSAGTDNPAVIGQAQGSNDAVVGVAAGVSPIAGSTRGGAFIGGGADVGVYARGGATNGTGIYADGGGTNGWGADLRGKGTGKGVRAEGGTNNGTGVNGVGGATNGRGGEFSGAGNGTGVYAESLVDGKGIQAQGGPFGLVGGSAGAYAVAGIHSAGGGGLSGSNGSGGVGGVFEGGFKDGTGLVGIGVVALGNGATHTITASTHGAGLIAVGGNSGAGIGVFGASTGTGHAIYASATGTGHAVVGFAGTGSGIGVYGTGGSTSPGVLGLGSNVSFVPVYGSQGVMGVGSDNASDHAHIGGYFLGGGASTSTKISGSGVYGIGGAAVGGAFGGSGGEFQGGNSASNNAGSGIVATGGTASGSAYPGYGGYFTGGATATSSARAGVATTGGAVTGGGSLTAGAGVSATGGNAVATNTNGVGGRFLSGNGAGTKVPGVIALSSDSSQPGLHANGVKIESTVESTTGDGDLYWQSGGRVKWVTTSDLTLNSGVSTAQDCAFDAIVFDDATGSITSTDPAPTSRYRHFQFTKPGWYFVNYSLVIHRDGVTKCFASLFNVTRDETIYGSSSVIHFPSGSDVQTLNGSALIKVKSSGSTSSNYLLVSEYLALRVKTDGTGGSTFVQKAGYGSGTFLVSSSIEAYRLTSGPLS